MISPHYLRGHLALCLYEVLSKAITLVASTRDGAGLDWHAQARPKWRMRAADGQRETKRAECPRCIDLGSLTVLGDYNAFY